MQTPADVFPSVHGLTGLEHKAPLGNQNWTDDNNSRTQTSKSGKDRANGVAAKRT